MTSMGAARDEEAGPGDGAPPGRLVLLVVLAGLLARALVAALAPPSDDLLGWRWVERVIAAGGNPYEETPRLNWPPLWMLWIGLCGWIARWSGLGFDVLVRLLPVAADAAATALLARLSVPLGLAYALHPVALATTGAQAQFDAVPALCVLVAALAVTTRLRSADAIAGVALGLGAGFKTWPILLAPVLALRLEGWRARARLLGVATAIPLFLLVPVAALAPDGFRDHVLGYASYPGWWGITGLGVVFRSGWALALAGFWADHGRFLLLAGVACTWGLARVLPTREAAVATLLAFLVLTPGFGPQYLLWLVPLSLVVQGRLVHLWHASVVVCTVFERVVMPYAGAGAAPGAAEAALVHNRAVNLVRLPVWTVSAIWLGALLLRALHRARAKARAAAGGELGSAGAADASRV